MTVHKAQNTDAAIENYRQRLFADYAWKGEPRVALAIPISVPDGATGDIDLVLTDKFEVTGVEVQKREGAGAAGNSITVKSGATAISDAINTNIADKATARAAAIDDAASTIEIGGTLRITRTKAGGNAACFVMVRGLLWKTGA